MTVVAAHMGSTLFRTIGKMVVLFGHTQSVHISSNCNASVLSLRCLFAFKIDN